MYDDQGLDAIETATRCQVGFGGPEGFCFFLFFHFLFTVCLFLLSPLVSSATVLTHHDRTRV